jgi:uncharacterized RDD family membrane protein YckC
VAGKSSRHRGVREPVSGIGKPPFEASRTAELLARIVSESPADFSQRGVEIPRGLQRIIFRALTKDTNKRFQDYAALRTALLPFSSRGFTIAGSARRLAAFLIDATILSMLTSNIAMEEAAMRWPLQGDVLYYLLIQILVPFVYFLITEKRWGRSLGKWLFDLKVADMRGAELTWSQALARTSVFSLFCCIHDIWPFLFGWFFWKIGIQLPMLSRQSGFLFLVSVAPMISARSGNGYAGLHELASRTRVWIRQRQDEVVSIPQSKPVGASLAGSVPGSFGPYKALTVLWETDADALILSRDEALRRDVWVRYFRDAAKAGQIGNMIGSREGRLRWLQGMRKPDESWDAYEAPSGTSLCDWVNTAGRLSWREMRVVLLDISKTLALECAKGNVGGTVSLEHIWITGYGQTRILDFPIPAKQIQESEAHDSRHWRMILQQVALFGLDGRLVSAAALNSQIPTTPLPEYAGPIIRSLCGQRARLIAPQQDCLFLWTRVDSRDSAFTSVARQPPVSDIRNCGADFEWSPRQSSPLPVESRRRISAVFYPCSYSQGCRSKPHLVVRGSIPFVSITAARACKCSDYILVVPPATGHSRSDRRHMFGRALNCLSPILHRPGVRALDIKGSPGTWIDKKSRIPLNMETSSGIHRSIRHGFMPARKGAA